MPAKVPDAAKRRPRHDRRRERNRRRLIDATVELAWVQGVESLSVAAIARHAEVDRSRFYALFDDVEACKEAAGQELQAHVAKAGKAFAEHAATMTPDAPIEARAEGIAAFMRVWMERPQFGKLILRTRYDRASIFGSLTEKIMRWAQQSITALLMDVATQRGIRGRHLPEVERVARLCIGLHWVAFETLIDGTETDIDQVCLSLARADEALILTELDRMRAEDRKLGSGP